LNSFPHSSSIDQNGCKRFLVISSMHLDTISLKIHIILNNISDEPSYWNRMRMCRGRIGQGSGPPSISHQIRLSGPIGRPDGRRFRLVPNRCPGDPVDSPSTPKSRAPSTKPGAAPPQDTTRCSHTQNNMAKGFAKHSLTVSLLDSLFVCRMSCM